MTTRCPKAEHLCPFGVHGCDFKVSEFPLLFSFSIYDLLERPLHGFNGTSEILKSTTDMGKK